MGWFNWSKYAPKIMLHRIDNNRIVTAKIYNKSVFFKISTFFGPRMVNRIKIFK